MDGGRIPSPPSRFILGMRVDATTYPDAARRVVGWAKSGESRYVCVATVNNVMEAHDDGRFLRAMNEADLVTPDGMPLVWGLRRLGIPKATRVYGPDLTPVVLDMAESEGIPVGFYGASPDVLRALLAAVARRWPDLHVAHASSPPFRDLSAEEDEEITLSIVASGARILFVGLGCPKQEQWMASHRGRLPAVMVGVGAAFDFLAGTKRQAPRILQRAGLEWAFRLATEPRRLWKRYLRNNPRFVLLFGRQLVRASLDRLRSSRPMRRFT
jgi:N-acetylglucosaminyldiphosphoundecaprenol N-acetyl-beta-D-mannosaminyltransferase